MAFMTHHDVLNGATLIENAAPLLAFCEIVLYRTHVRRRKRFHKIYLRFSMSDISVSILSTR